MIIHPKFVFVHTPRCGGTFVRRALRSTHGCPSPPVRFFHIPVKELEPKHRNKFKFGFVRNPWQWYVSWYHHQSPDGFWMRALTKGRKPTFETFLRNALNRDILKPHVSRLTHTLGNPRTKKTVPVFKYLINSNVGFVTYRYVYMYCNEYDKILTSGRLANLDDQLSVDKVYKQDNMVGALSNAMKRAGLSVTPEHQRVWRSLGQNVNQSSRRRNFRSYYTTSMVDLVAKKDKVIIDQYGFSFK